MSPGVMSNILSPLLVGPRLQYMHIKSHKLLPIDLVLVSYACHWSVVDRDARTYVGSRPSPINLVLVSHFCHCLIMNHHTCVC